jgi:hypothetical protein
MLQFAIFVMLSRLMNPRSAYQVKYWHSGTQGNPHDCEGASGNDQKFVRFGLPGADSGTFTNYRSVFSPCRDITDQKLLERLSPEGTVPRSKHF